MSVKSPKIKSVVTGGGGFLGSHLCDRLIGLGHEVICLDNLSTGSKDNLAQLLSNPNFRFIEHDIVNPIQLEFDEIYNLACPASPVHYQADPLATTRTCVIGALNCLEAATANGARILQASTSEIYGDAQISPQSESYFGNVNPIGLRSCYDEGKRCAESLFFDFHRMHDTRIKIVRIFNTYGPRMQRDDGRVVSNFIIQALTGTDITIYGNGLQTRSFCYVDDLIDGMIAMMRSEDSFLGPVNLGNTIELPVKNLADEIVRLTNSTSNIVFKPLPADDPKQRRPDIGKAESQLMWTPEVGLTDGLCKTIAYFSRQIELDVAG